MTKQIKNPFIVSFIFLIFSVIFLSIFFNKISRDNLSEQIEHRQQLSARSGAKSVGAFLRGVGRSLLVLSSDPSQIRLDRFIESWKVVGVTGIVSIDKNGKVIAASNRENKTEIGRTVMDRGYFKWAKSANKGDYYIDTPIVSKAGSTIGKYIVTVTAPVIDDNNNFNGAIVAAVLVSDIVDIHLSDLKILDSSKLYLVSNEGLVIYSDENNMVGRNFENKFTNDFLGKKKVIDALNTQFKSKEDSTVKIAIPDENNYSFKLTPYLVSSSPINLNDQFWKVVVLSPERELNVFTYNVFNKQILAIFIFVSLFIVLTLRSTRNSGYHEAVVDEHEKHGIS